MQLHLFTGDPSPREHARRTDPPTSHEAAERVCEGSASACKAVILSRLQRGPASALELAQMPGLNYRARISDLRRDGWVIDADQTSKPTVYRLRGRG